MKVNCRRRWDTGTCRRLIGRGRFRERYYHPAGKIRR